jgi:hypothetical protein
LTNAVSYTPSVQEDLLEHTLMRQTNRQEEVDNLTKRAKLSESAFLAIFQPLYDAPDPVAALLSATDATQRAVDADAENHKLQVGGASDPSWSLCKRG